MTPPDVDALARVAQWLGGEYRLFTDRAGIVHPDRIDHPDGDGPLDDDQLLGAILRRAAELHLFPLLEQHDARGWSFGLFKPDDAYFRGEYGPTPLSAALAAVEAMTKEQQT